MSLKPPLWTAEQLMIKRFGGIMEHKFIVNFAHDGLLSGWLSAGRGEKLELMIQHNRRYTVIVEVNSDGDGELTPTGLVDFVRRYSDYSVVICE